MGNPQFDPNQPYQSAPTQGGAAFDPNQPYQSASQDSSSLPAGAVSGGGSWGDAFRTTLGLEDPELTTENLQNQSQVGVGMAKSLGQTLTAPGRLMPTAVTGVDTSGVSDALKPSNMLQEFGAGIEQAYEWILSDGALAMLSPVQKAEKALAAMKAAKKLAGESPLLARALEVGMETLKGAGVGGVVGGIHNGVEGAESGAVMGGAAGAVGGVVGEGLDMLANRGAAKAGQEAMANASSPMQRQVGAATRESGIDLGTPNATQDAMGTNQMLGEQGKNQYLQGKLQDVVEQTTKDAGLEYTPSASPRDTVGSAARSFLNDAKGDFKTLDEASGGRWQRYDDQIKNIQKKMDEVNGIDDSAYTNLEIRRNEIETLQAQMIEDMKTAGKVDPKIADSALAKYRQGMALNDLNGAVRASTKRALLGDTMADVTDPAMLGARLQKMNDTPLSGGASRLEQAVGKDQAKQLIEYVDNMQLLAAASKGEVGPEGATGRWALRELIRPNTTVEAGLGIPLPETIAGVKVPLAGKLAGKPQGVTDWNGVLKDFETLGAAKQKTMFGSEVPKVRTYIQKQAMKQNLMDYLKKAGKLGAGIGVGEAGYHYLFDRK